MYINGREIGKGFPPYIIAEMSGNHNGSIDRAISIIKQAKKSGADAVKLQTYTADTMTLNVEHPRFRVAGENPWDGEHLYELYRKASTPWEWHEELFNLGREIGITIFSSPFDSTAVDFLESLNAPAYKIASFELVDHELIKKCVSTGKPIIMSTGMASLEEISEAMDVANSAGAKDIALLKCTSAYPAPYQDMNLKTIPDLTERFNTLAGLSDHTLGIEVSIAAVALGASIIEKHFTLARTDGGVDSDFSIEPNELFTLTRSCRNTFLSLGDVTYNKSEIENSFKQYRRSLFIINDLKKGQMLTEKDVKSLRPGSGLEPKYLSDIIGKKLNQNVTRGTPVTWELVN